MNKLFNERYSIQVQDDFLDFIKKVSLNKEIDLGVNIDKDRILINIADVFSKITGIYNNISLQSNNEFEMDLITIPNSKRFVNYLSILKSNFLFYKHINEEINVNKLLLMRNDTDYDNDVYFDITLYLFEENNIKPINDENIVIKRMLTSNNIKSIQNILKAINSNECYLLFEYMKDEKAYRVKFVCGGIYEDEAHAYLFKLEEDEFDKSYFLDEFIKNKDQNSYMVKYNYKDLCDVFSVIDKGDDANVTFNIKQGGGLIFIEENENYKIYYGLLPYS